MSLLQTSRERHVKQPQACVTRLSYSSIPDPKSLFQMRLIFVLRDPDLRKHQHVSRVERVFHKPIYTGCRNRDKNAINHSSGDPSLAAGSALNYLAPRRDLDGEDVKAEK